MIVITNESGREVLMGADEFEELLAKLSRVREQVKLAQANDDIPALKQALQEQHEGEYLLGRLVMYGCLFMANGTKTK